MANRWKSHKKPKHEESVKVRLCLMCRDSFKSTWSGDRVCRKCKATSTWRSGSVGTAEVGK